MLLIDEIDSLVGDTLISVLRQLRAGYDQRPEGFPQSVALCGVRDVRDYRIRSGSENAAVAGGSVFNIRAGSLRLEGFTEAEVRALLVGNVGAPARDAPSAIVDAPPAAEEGERGLAAREGPEDDRRRSARAREPRVG